MAVKSRTLELFGFSVVNLFSPWQLSPGHWNYLDFLLLTYLVHGS